MITSINSDNLIQRIKNSNVQRFENLSTPSFASDKTNLIEQYLKSQAVLNEPIVSHTFGYKNNLRTLFKENNVKMLGIIPRTFNAKDTNGNAKIDEGEIHGTFLNAIDRLDEIQSEGFNCLHVLPIHPTGKIKAMGTAGSLYSPQDFLKIDSTLVDKNDPRTPEEQMKAFVDECHKRGIRVMLDLPSCASYDLFLTRNELMAKEQDGLAKTPQGWNDIRMFEPWKDEEKRELNPQLLKLHRDYIDMFEKIGIDGIRADVSRAKPPEFWDAVISYSRAKDPEFAWLGETYTYEDASPQANMPYDRPQDALRAGFDAVYGQYHIFHEWQSASALMDYVKENLEMSNELERGKSLLGSFATHDDLSPMYHGGTDYCNLTTGLQLTLPMLNSYFVDGFQSGDYYDYPYANSYSENTMTDNHQMTVHQGKLDIFNLSRKPGGNNPEIGKFMTEVFKMHDKNEDVLSRGSFIPLDKKSDKNDDIIAFARHLNGKTILVAANKNINRNASAVIKIPTLKETQALKNLLPQYGQKSRLQARSGELAVDLAPARIHVFEIDTPQIEEHTKVYRQKL